jgi:hypothetical protein
MNREEKIQWLQNLLVMIEEWHVARQKTGYDAEHEIEIRMAANWGVASEILSGYGFRVEIELADSSRGKNIKPQIGDIFYQGVFSNHGRNERHQNMLAIHSYVLGAIQKIQQGVVGRENVLPDINLLTGILKTFPDVVSRLTHRRKDKTIFPIEDEYDVQDILYVMMKGSFSTLQYEDPTQKVGINSARPDFAIHDLNTYIEVKFIGRKGQEKDIQDECSLDIQKYGALDDCNKIIFFIYDPKKCIDNSYAFRAELEKARTVEGRDVEVITLILN